ncbi:hypothetical protein E1B28_008396 [Marasmius oreades]|uniref:Uncharacterized protein n=1 Tax=Marasmius oreades TaxID=181124 RepID=A0A9P7RYG0_9AGAR|nr:uncharacterized protein E1B28_008396 [Marasmius oreades]KAG7092010.1 hypothetical protein E1B28_008396 [Marasmius oreades]
MNSWITLDKTVDMFELRLMHRTEAWNPHKLKQCHLSQPNTESTQTFEDHTNHLTQLINQHLPQLEDDNNDNDAVRDLSNLFDFTKPFWVNKWENNAQRS